MQVLQAMQAMLRCTSTCNGEVGGTHGYIWTDKQIYGWTHGCMDGPMWHPPMGLASGWALPSRASSSTARCCVLQRLQDAKIPKGEFCSPGEEMCCVLGESFPVCIHIFFCLEGKPPLPSQL